MPLPEIEAKVKDLNLSTLSNVETIKNYHEKFLNVKSLKHKTEQELKALKEKVSKLEKKENYNSIVLLTLLIILIE